MKNKYEARYFNAPPDLPDFFYKNPRYAQKSVAQLIQWATNEYRDALRLFSRRKAYKQVEYMSREYSELRVLAEFPEFIRIASLITQEAWNQLSGRQRVFLRRAFELHTMLGL